jgi:hypothetical protein
VEVSGQFFHCSMMRNSGGCGWPRRAQTASKESSNASVCACARVHAGARQRMGESRKTDRTYLSMVFAAFAERVVVLVCGAHQDSVQRRGVISSVN